MSSNAVGFEEFAKVYNDRKRFPTLADVALKLNLAYQTVRNKARIIRRLKDNGAKVPELISRVNSGVPVEEPELSSRDHADNRAGELRESVHELLMRSRYPVINPQSVIVESYLARSYQRSSGRYEMIEGTPRTWLSDTLRVAPVPRCEGLRFIFTGAQNDSPLHQEFWDNLKAYADWIDAEIIVGPLTYETQWWSENNPSARSYDKQLTEHLCFGQMAIGDNFVFCGEMNTLPTASRPISDLVTYSRGRWAVFPHSKLQLKSVPSTDPDEQAHQVMTTGVVTLPKVLPRKAGIRSIFHHVIGATLVEFDDEGDIFCRQINASDDGSFYDLDRFVCAGEVSENQNIEALTAPDIHVAKLDRRNAESVFYSSDSIYNVLKPKQTFLHDLHDNEARNHHNKDDNAQFYELAIRQRDDVRAEVQRSVDFVCGIKRDFGEVHVVPSNHDLALERYVREGRYRLDGKNIRYGLQLEDAYLGWREQVAKALDDGVAPPDFCLLEHAMRKLERTPGALDHVKWIIDGKSYLVNGIECGHHGFRGANGSQALARDHGRRLCRRRPELEARLQQGPLGLVCHRDRAISEWKEDIDHPSEGQMARAVVSQN
jgi:hypothetical protein